MTKIICNFFVIFRLKASFLLFFDLFKQKKRNNFAYIKKKS